MKRIYGVCIFLLAAIAIPNTALAFRCQDASGNLLDSDTGGTQANAYVNLAPQVGVNQNLVVDISASISCANVWPDVRNDEVSLYQGSAFNGALANFRGSLNYFGTTYAFPLTVETKMQNFTTSSYVPLQAILYLTPVSSAGGVVIQAGTRFASISIHQRGSDRSDGGQVRNAYFVWNLYARNNVVIPTGGCDVSARNVTVNLPTYPATAAVPLTVRCPRNQNLAYYLTGTTANAANTIFTNTSSSSPAQGIGVQISNGAGVIATNSTKSLGVVGASGASLGLTASYARTTGQVTAGSVQSLIGVTFVYQ